MQAQEFREWGAKEGFGEAKPLVFEANRTTEAHVHEQTAAILVVSGEWKLVPEEEETVYRVGEICTLPAGKSHQEVSGETPTKLLIAWK